MFENYRVRNDIKLADDVPQADPAKLAAKNGEIAALRKTTEDEFFAQLAVAEARFLRNVPVKAN